MFRQGDQEIELARVEGTLLSLGKLCNLMHCPPGDLLTMRFPRSQIVPRVAGADRICMRPIRADTHALKLVSRYVGIAQDSRTVVDFDMQQPFANHVYDLIALSVGATRDAADLAHTRGLRAAQFARHQGVHRQTIWTSPNLSSAALAKPPSMYDAVHSSAVRNRGHDPHRLRMRTTPGARLLHVDRPAPQRRADHSDCL